MAGVLVYIETEGGRPCGSSLEALGEGRRIASTLGASLYAFAPIENGEAPGFAHDALAATLGGAGADKVVLMPVPARNGPPTWSNDGDALSAACDHLRPALILLAATGGGRDLGPRLAARLAAAFVPEPAIERGPRGEVVLSRVVYGATHRRRLAIEDLGHPVVATLTPGIHATALGGDDAEVLMLDPRPARPEESPIRWLSRGADPGRALDGARILVVAGNGVTAQTWPLVGELAAALGAELGATRELCERGIAPAHAEIGVGARRVTPHVYVVCGVSGSSAHLGGVWAEAEIIAIDRNPDAPIFRVASYGIVGEIERVVPELIAALAASPPLAASS